MKNDLKCHRYLVEAGAVSLNHINCEPNMSLIHHQSEKNDSLSWKILILDVVGVVAGGDEKIFFAAKYKTGLDDKVRLSVSSVTGVESYVVVQTAVMKEKHKTGVISWIQSGRVNFEGLPLWKYSESYARGWNDSFRRCNIKATIQC